MLAGTYAHVLNIENERPASGILQAIPLPPSRSSDDWTANPRMSKALFTVAISLARYLRFPAKSFSLAEEGVAF